MVNGTDDSATSAPAGTIAGGLDGSGSGEEGAAAAPKRAFTAKSIGLLLLIIVAFPIASLALLWKDRCKSQIIAEPGSPDGSVQVDRILTDCGPSMRVAAEVKLTKTVAAKVIDTTNVLVMVAKDPLSLHWDGPGRLVINLPPQAEVAKRLEEWQGVHFTWTGGPIADPHARMKLGDNAPTSPAP